VLKGIRDVPTKKSAQVKEAIKEMGWRMQLLEMKN
jgi:hypothetical protein